MYDSYSNFMFQNDGFCFQAGEVVQLAQNAYIIPRTVSW